MVGHPTDGRRLVGHRSNPTQEELGHELNGPSPNEPPQDYGPRSKSWFIFHQSREELGKKIIGKNKKKEEAPRPHELEQQDQVRIQKPLEISEDKEDKDNILKEKEIEGHPGKYPRDPELFILFHTDIILH
jgi:hypothetical protein